MNNLIPLLPKSVALHIYELTHSKKNTKYSLTTKKAKTLSSQKNKNRDHLLNNKP